MRTMLLAGAAFVYPLFAQAPANPLSADIKANWTAIKGNIRKAADRMPEEHWSFRPTDKVRSFGAIVAHVADAHYLLCGAEKGEKRELTVEKTKTSKADILAALDESFAYCDSSYDALTDAKAAESIKFFNRERPRAGALNVNISHDWEHYGNLVTYMRIKGLVPPTSKQ
jgi:uncharacterized damage-inducible protein DinB